MSKKSMHPAAAIVGGICGVAIMAGSLVGWHYFRMDGLVSFVVAGAGFALLTKCLTGTEMDF